MRSEAQDEGKNADNDQNNDDDVLVRFLSHLSHNVANQRRGIPRTLNLSGWASFMRIRTRESGWSWQASFCF